MGGYLLQYSERSNLLAVKLLHGLFGLDICRIPRIDPLIYSCLSTIFPAPIGVVPASRDPGAYDLAVSYTRPRSILGLM